ncbi:MAG TPA: bifunctional 5,10-methylene-tetrahydrofolate dehydrogenase/5,10-methylene-tetrahydrofolate cyclohydrolase [Bacteroidales bacterium]|jgi:methylenetetrahydrofolate dehydrogenase (NADP+)/methenyltetrahydrofolate cyclohydrolase|nr:bifunctional 5,10-methylene-tetrahydrofolate dehydrogenase/5,10-methylene-tetrahydrofolate cyclohydrolase [Bacteroidales bacterium]
MYQIIDGKQTSAVIRGEIAAAVTEIRARGERVPHLAAILVGNDGGSETYVSHKVKDCEEVGFRSTLLRMPSTVTEEELLDKVRELNQDPGLDGLIVQLPLPDHIRESRVIETIAPEKDVDGFHPVNVGRMTAGLPSFVSATPAGIMELLKRYNIPLKGAECVVVGRSNIVGRPVSILMSQKGADATVTVVHSRTRNIAEIVRRADIVIAAIGQPGFITADMIKEGAVVIDVGTTRVDAPDTKAGWRLKGDVDFENVAPRCSFITPVPGGVGPMTRVSLLLNTLQACRKQ